MNSLPPQPSRAAKARLFLLDDEPAVRKGLAQLINLEPDLIVCGDAATVSAARERIAALRPDVAVVDLTLKDDDGFALIHELRRQHPHLRILVFSMHDELRYVRNALRAGAHGYVTKDEGAEHALLAVHSLLQGRNYLSQELSARIALG